MSIVSSSISEGNPITSDDVHAAASSLGFEISPDEISAHTALLSAFYDTCEEISSLPNYIPEQLRPRQIPNSIRKVSAEDNEFGHSWSYRFSLRDAVDDSATINGNSRNAISTEKLKLLEGKNIILKDNIAVAGVPQIYGTKAIESWTPDFNATVVSRIVEAGGHIVGTATCEAMSTATASNTASVGPVYNPYAPGYSAGGSSSGVGALVGNPGCHDQEVSTGSSHISVDMGVGADQGGSIRVPAAFCGLVGLKPTFGLVPYTGVTSAEPVLDHVGPMCKTVWDVAVLLEVIAGKDGLDDRQIDAPRHGETKYSSELKEWYRVACNTHPLAPLTGKKIAILSESIDAPFVKPEMKAVVRKAAKDFIELGASVAEISMPWHNTGRSLWAAACRQSLTSAALGNPAGRRQFYPLDFMSSLLPWSQEKWDKLPIAMRNELINGDFERSHYPCLYQKAMNLSLRLKEEYETLFRQYDVLLLPSVPFTAPPLFDRNTASPWDVLSSTFGQTLNTLQFNLTGHPALSLPVGMHSDMAGKQEGVMLPVSVQLVASMNCDNRVLEFGYAYEDAYDWTTNSK